LLQAGGVLDSAAHADDQLFMAVAASCFIFNPNAVIAGAGRPLRPPPAAFYSLCGTAAEIELD